MNLTTLLAGLLCLVCAVPIVHFVRTRQGAFIALFAFEFSQYYAMPVLILTHLSAVLGGAELPPAIVQRAVVYATLAAICVFTGYFLVGDAGVVPRIRMNWRSDGLAILVAMTACAIGFPAYLLFSRQPDLQSPGQLAMAATALVMYGIAILFTLQLFGRLSLIYVILLWGLLIPLRILLGASTGSAAQTVMLGLLLILIYVQVRKRIWWTAVIFGMLFFFLIRPAMTPFRSLTWKGGPYANASHLEKVKLFFRVMEQVVSGRFGNSKVIEEFAATRLCSACALADVVRQTGSIVPYWGGASYYPLLVKPIPRFLWKDKPKEESGQTFGHRYGFLANNDFTTTFNLPQTVELYANFGLPGLVIGSLLFGMFYRFIELMFFHPRSGIGSLALGGVFLSQALIIETAISGVFGGLIVSLLIISVINFGVDFFEVTGRTIAVGGERSSSGARDTRNWTGSHTRPDA